MVDQNGIIRRIAFEWLQEMVDIHGDVLSRTLLSRGFDYNGIRVPLVAPNGIFKPQLLTDAPLTITTAPDGPYKDSFSKDGLLWYKYRGMDPLHRDNVGLRNAMKAKIPLIYLFGLAPGRYLAAWPVFIVGDDKKALTFTVAVDDPLALNKALEGDSLFSIEEGVEPIRRKYITSVVKQRLHQGVFRERVIAAYKSQCALCRLRHSELLDAAHIVPDSDPEGEPHVSNGLALCKIHHAAFDREFLAITPDYEVRIRDDLMLESDGPMLKHGLQGMNGTKILLPNRVSDRPNREFLERRFNKFIGHMAT